MNITKNQLLNKPILLRMFKDRHLLSIYDFIYFMKYDIRNVGFLPQGLKTFEYIFMLLKENIDCYEFLNDIDDDLYLSLLVKFPRIMRFCPPHLQSTERWFFSIIASDFLIPLKNMNHEILKNSKFWKQIFIYIKEDYFKFNFYKKNIKTKHFF